MFKKRFPSLSSLGTDGNTAFLRAARAGHLDKVLEHLKTNIDINTSNANGLNALHLASKDGHVNVVTELLKRGASVDAATKKGNTALHIASLAGQEEVVKLLVQHGAAVNVQSQNGFTPLYMAAQENHDNVVRFLLANGANQSLATEDGFTPLAVAMQQGHDKVVAVLLESDTRGKVRLPALHIAAKKDDCKAAALLLQNEHNPDVTSKSGFTPLHIAAHYGNENIANLLLTKGADVNYSAKHNITPLHVAAKWGKSNMVALLLEKGGNIESKTRDGLTPLHCAARSGHEQVVDMLLERGAPISSKTKNGLAPLHMASQGDHVDAARILLYHRAPVDEVTVDYLTALHVAAHCGHVRVAKLLLDRKADPDARALNGFTPLHIACKKNRIKVVELLLKHGASIEATTESGLTPLHVASFMGCMNIVIFLLQHNANPDVPTIRGETPLHLAARANQTDIIRILLRNGAQVDARAREQQTPLHIASRLGNVDIVMLLLQHGAQIDATTKDMYTALHIAAKEGQEEVASVLLEHGAALTATTKKGFTPLHLAAKYGNIKVAQLLLQRDAPVDAQGKNGVTPLHVASHYDHKNVALLLLDKGASPHATAKNGHTPLHIAARKNQMDIATTLLEYGAKADAESKAGFTPLHLSAQEGHTDMTNLLIEHQADPNHKAKNGLTPLHLCSQEDKPNVAALLIKNEAEVDAVTKAGYTPLHVASHFGQVNTVRFLLEQGADVEKCTSIGYTPLHQAAQQGHATIVQLLLDNGASPNAQTSQGQTALSIAQKLGYISVVEALKGVTTDQGASVLDEKYRVVAPETMQEIFMSDSEDENGEDTMLSDQPYRYLTVDEMKSLGDDSLPIDVTRDERMDSNKEAFGMTDDAISPQHAKEHYAHFANFTPDNVDISRHPINVGFLVSFLVDARGGAMRGCRHSGVRVIIPPRKATMPMRVTCRYLKRDKLIHPPPLMEGEALASRVLELGPVGAKFLGPVIIEVPHFASLRGTEREIVILRSDNGETWREHTMEASDDVVHDVLNESFDGEELSQIEDLSSGRITRILTNDFPQYFAIVSRIRQEVHPIGPDGGMVSSTVVPQVQAVFPQGALTKKIKVGLQAQPIPAELTAKLLGNRVAVSPIVTVEPRRRKFHKPITLTIPVPRAANKGMINQYSGDAPTLRLLCSITGGTSRAQWEDVTGSTPLTFVNDCVSFTTTVSARFWLMDCRNIAEATKMATELYREAIHVPFMAKFVVFAKRVDVLEARLRVFCMTDDREDKTLEHQEHFTEVAKSRDVEVLEGKAQYVEFAGNLVPVTKSGDQLRLGFKAFRENRLPFTVRVKDPHVDSVGRLLFMREAKVGKGDPPQQPICCLNIVLPETIMPDSVLSEPDLFALQKKISSMRDSGIEAQRTDLRLSDISNLLGYDWVNLAQHLGIQESDINLVKTESPANIAQQARAMLRLWLYLQGNKASGKSLETALHRINRDDIAEQCIFNEQIKSKSSAQKEELGTSRTGGYDERDIMKVSESVEDLMQTDIKGQIRADERDEKKYLAEEKEVEEEEEEKKTVKERKQEIERRLSQERQYSETQRRSLSISDEKIVKPKQQRHSVATDFVHTEIKVEELSKQEKEILEKEDLEKSLSVKEKISQFQDLEKKQEEPSKTQTPPKSTEQEVMGEQRQYKTVQEIMEDESKKISSEIKGDTSKSTKTSENIIKSQKEENTKVEKLIGKTKDIINEEEKILSELTKTEEQTQFLVHEQLSDEQVRRKDSALLEGVTEGLERFGKIEEASKDLLSPKASKTPPPSPADFLTRGSPPASAAWNQTQTSEPTTSSLEYSEKGQSECIPETQGIRSDQVPESVEKQIDSTTRTIQTETKIEILEEQIRTEKRGGKFEEFDLSSASQPKENESTGYVTTPTSNRRVQSQRIPGDQRPSVTPYQGESELYSSDEEKNYTVDEPEDLVEHELNRIHSYPDNYGPVLTQKRKSLSLADTPLTEEKVPPEEPETEEFQKNGSASKTIEESKSEIEIVGSDLEKEKDGKSEIKESSLTESVEKSEKSEKTFEYDGADATSEASQSIISNTETLLDAPKAGLITDSGISTASKDISDLTEAEHDAAGKEISEVKEEPDESDKSESETKPRVIFHIESEEDLQSDIESDQVPIPIDSSSSTEEFIEKVKQDLKTTLEREQLILEEKLSMRSRIFDDLSDESLSKTKELVDERLRKISESRIPKESEEPVIMIKKEKSPASSEPVEELKIGRFHVTPAQVDDSLEEKEKFIAERLKTEHKAEESSDEIEKELPEKLTEEDIEDVIRELKMEGLKTEIYLEKDEDKEEKTLKRVERRFERMASETLDKEKEEENVSEETLNEKREVEFQRMISQLSTEEVAECQQEYLQLWDEGGLSSLTPTDEWESRDPDTPENELEEDSPRKPGKEEGQSSSSKDEPSKGASATEKETGISSRPPLVSDISMDDEAEYDTTEHDWRHQLEILHAEAEEGEIEANEGEIDEQLDAALASSFTPHHK